MVHQALRWPKMADKSLWPMAFQHVTFMNNHLPRTEHRWSPEELWTGTKSIWSELKNARPWGCPCYVLAPKLQDGAKIPKWNPRARGGIYIGNSPYHSSTVGLIRNLRTGNILPQFHVVYNDYFETVLSSPEQEPDSWEEIVVFQSFESSLEENDEFLTMTWTQNG